tara:strand:+ start:1180 stop:2415 length:1236 start_codon:yes stop_codon:yes gene_type:complete
MIKILLILLLFQLHGCDNSASPHSHDHDSHDDHSDEEIVKGLHGGRLLTQDDFTLELAIVEAGIPPEYRVWAIKNGQTIDPSEVTLKIELDRLGGIKDIINFKPQSDFLRGDDEIYEPHSFDISVNATYKGKTYNWQYENHEGRTSIDPAIADSFGLTTLAAGPATLKETITVYGEITSNPEGIRNINARFDGEIKNVYVSEGDLVDKGQLLANVESNESLTTYSIKSPIRGVITQRTMGSGEQTMGKILFTIMDTQSLWANLKIFPSDRAEVSNGSTVVIRDTVSSQTYTGKISNISVTADDNQSVTARVIINNKDNLFTHGMFIQGDITTAVYTVPLAVKRTGLQSFRDFTVVYAMFGNQYEVRMLELGRQDSEWAEVLGGIDPGTPYVVDNSYIVKADIEKSAASHDH